MGNKDTFLLPEVGPRKRLRLPRGARELLKYLQRQKTWSTEGFAFPMQKTLAEYLGTDRKGIRRWTVKLINAGLLSRRRDPEDRRRWLYFPGREDDGECQTKIRGQNAPYFAPQLGGILPPILTKDELRDYSSNNRQAAVADQQTKPEEGATTLRQPIQGTLVPAAEPSAMTPAERRELVARLVERGLSDPLAEGYVDRATDPALIREILAYHQAEKERGNLQKPIGALRSMLESPAKWNFECKDGVWKRPADDRPGQPSARDRAKADAELARQRQEDAARAERFQAKPARTMRSDHQ